MHQGVEDATTSVLGGWFMPTECVRGYARMMRKVVTRHGVPRAIYSDKGSVFRDAKDGSITQFALVIRDLGVRMVFENSPQAGQSARRALQLHRPDEAPPDALRFGIGSYSELNAWFNDFYAPYLNSKFIRAARPGRRLRGPAALTGPQRGVPHEGDKALARLHHLLRGSVYMMADADGVALKIPDGTRLDVHADTLSDEMYVERSGRRWACVRVANREGRGPVGAQDRRELQRLPSEMQGEGAARRG